eukprot:174132-Pelagomonas_calceolata.AAC.1
MSDGTVPSNLTPNRQPSFHSPESITVREKVWLHCLQLTLGRDVLAEKLKPAGNRRILILKTMSTNDWRGNPNAALPGVFLTLVHGAGKVAVTEHPYTTEEK